jgi:hypothetical protein
MTRLSQVLAQVMGQRLVDPMQQCEKRPVTSLKKYSNCWISADEQGLIDAPR